MSKEQQMLQAIWRKALKQGKVEIEFKTPQDANRARFALYNSVKLVRKGKVFDDELQRAIDECIIRIVDEKTLSVEQRMESGMMKTLAQSFRDSDMIEFLQPEPKTEEELRQEEFMAQMLEESKSQTLTPQEIEANEVAKKYRGY